jgi:hypothetical protein
LLDEKVLEASSASFSLQLHLPLPIGDHVAPVMSITLVKGSDQEEGWRSELWEFLDFVAEDATKDMDIVRWWQVCCLLHVFSLMKK